MSDLSLPALNIDSLKSEARYFALSLNGQPIPFLYGTTDGKAIGTYVEQLFRQYLLEKYSFVVGNSAIGIDFPALLVDLKVTSIKQPQSSYPFRNASQKIYGLGYHILILVYRKSDDKVAESAHLSFEQAVFVDRNHTADFQLTTQILQTLNNNGNQDDIEALLADRNLPLDEIGRSQLAERIIAEPPLLGYLTISNALQWRLQYKRVIDIAAKGETAGVENLLA